MSTTTIPLFPAPSPPLSLNAKLLIFFFFIFSTVSFLLLLSNPPHFKNISTTSSGHGGATGDSISGGGPITALDYTACGLAIKDNSATPVECCPPTSTGDVSEFVLPPPPESLRIRRAAHLVDDEYVAKFSRAIQLMKELPDDDPRSFKQQARIHCAYCNGAYHFVKSPQTPIQIHDSWLFYPFHRYYIYFTERILGKLIGDPTFALPFWNWDSPDGMPMPVFFTDPNSSLYDELRDPKHRPPAVVDVDYLGTDSTRSAQQQAYVNLVRMYRQVVSGARTPELFFGSSYHPGDPPHPGMASIEVVHGLIHYWVGDRAQPQHENMGAFYSSARDPIFYSHHSNIDRMWPIWKTIEGGGRNRTDLTDPDWLNSEFLFYDEEARLVKAKVRDCLDTTKLGYVYEDVPVAWLNTRPTPRVRRLSRDINTTTTTITNVFPIKLDKVVRVLVKRGRSKASRTDEEELLVIEGIEMDGDIFVKFDVIVNDGGDEAAIGPENTEFAGSFVNLPTLHGKKTTSRLKLGISEILQDLGAAEDDSVLVTLVPRCDLSAGSVTIAGVSIE